MQALKPQGSPQVVLHRSSSHSCKDYAFHIISDESILLGVGVGSPLLASLCEYGSPFAH